MPAPTSHSTRPVGRISARPVATARSTEQPPAPLRFLRVDEVVHRTGLARSTIYDLMRAGRFPSAIRLGGGKSRSVAWAEHQVLAWMREQMAAAGKVAE